MYKYSFINKNNNIKTSLKHFVTIAIVLLMPYLDAIHLVNNQMVLASTLTPSNCIPFTTVVENVALPVAEFQGIIYIPEPDGLYKYCNKTFTKLYDGNPNFVSVSRDGNLLAFSEKGNINIYNLITGKVIEVLKSDNKSVFYEQPSWLHKGNRILYTKTVMEPNAKTENLIKKSIYILNLNTMEQSKVADGTFPSYVKVKNGIVFERNNKIIFKSLKNNSEKIIDEGMFPNSSPNGSFIAYVKVERYIKEVQSNVKIEENIHNIWIADSDDFSIKRRVTCNFPLKLIDQEDWLKNLQPSNSLQILLYNGIYCYLYPNWSSDSKNIFSIIRIYPYKNERIKSNLVKVNVSGILTH